MNETVVISVWVVLLGVLVTIDRVKELRSDYSEEYRDDLKYRFNNLLSVISIKVFIPLFLLLIAMKIAVTLGFVLGAYTILTSSIRYLPLFLLLTTSFYSYQQSKPFLEVLKKGEVDSAFENMNTNKYMPALDFIVIAVTIGFLI